MRFLLFSCLAGALAIAPAAHAAKPMEIFFLDTEGGQSTLIVSPSGQSLLIDTGWRGMNGRDADRIVKAAKSAHVKQIDYVVITHYHRDHVGGVPQLMDRMHVGTFVDHGPNRENSKVVREDYADYLKVLPRAQHMVAKPGDKIPVKGLDVTVLTADGRHITAPLAGAGQPNPYCASEPKPEADPSENARSLGTLIQYGNFRMIDLGDLTKAKELELVCPNNLIGTIDLYLTTHHGLALSNARAIVDALHPRVAVMNNGARKGGAEQTWTTVENSPGLQQLWQVHYAVANGKEHNVADPYIANVDEQCEGKAIKVTAESDGTFTVTNLRDGFSKTYRK